MTPQEPKYRPFVPPPHLNAEIHPIVMAAFERMTPEEFLAAAVRAGIYNPDGTLTPSYAPGEVRRRKRRK